jgi:hypothetical protein
MLIVVILGVVLPLAGTEATTSEQPQGIPGAGGEAHERASDTSLYVDPSEWHHQDWAETAGSGGDFANHLSQLGRRPENLAAVYDRAAHVLHIWYRGRDEHIRYAYHALGPVELAAEVPVLNFFKQDRKIVPAGIGGSQPVPIYFEAVNIH